MKIKDGFMLRTVADSTVVVPYSEAVDFNGMITLNRTGAFIWKQLQTETTRDELIALLIKEYSIDKATAAAGADSFIKRLGEEGFLE